MEEPLGPEIRDEPEVEQDDAALARHEHVGRLDVAVELARAVERAEAFDELAQRGAQQRLVAASDAAKQGPGSSIPDGARPVGGIAPRRPDPASRHRSATTVREWPSPANPSGEVARPARARGS